ncbi:MAG: hypothetical protein J6D87_09650 [Clostridia bacterium]|nr:hypothetical protein [Clostridia bacterium]MBQ7316109.1 hypothetical protein [Clostridia bacterium]
MNREKELPKRKRLRLKNFDYSTPGAYFITICTHNRKCTLSRVVGAIHESPETKLTDYGKILNEIIQNIPERHKATIDMYVIMPNHIHFIIIITDDEELRAIRESPLRGRSIISKVIGYIKMNASKEIHCQYGDATIWQRGFHDHVIRDRQDYEKIAKYIDENPLRWKYDCFYAEE